MIEICFEEKNDAMHVYRQLLKRAEVLYKETSVYLQEQKVVIHIPVRESNYIEKILLPVMVYFIVNVKQNEWIYTILKEKIYLYTKEQDHNMIITLRNVFQERVQLHGLHDFERNVKNFKNKGNALDFLSF
ncbi:hypothetical protein C1I58_16395 [Bacillus sp. PIC28]|nr:hypothetical protein C1I58_16395 [Bacillus sp. PIC28]